MQALSLQLADSYIGAFGKLASHSNTLVVPANAGDTASMITQALGIFRNVDSASEEMPPCPWSHSLCFHVRSLLLRLAPVISILSAYLYTLSCHREARREGKVLPSVVAVIPGGVYFETDPR